MEFEKPPKQSDGSEKELCKIRITITGKDVPALENVCSDLKDLAKSLDMRVRGPVRLPTRILKVSPRKSPSGEGSKSFDHYEMRIHKRLIDLIAPSEDAKKLGVNVEPGIDIEVQMLAYKT